jgi:NADH-quinone oxidoreductase subunit N
MAAYVFTAGGAFGLVSWLEADGEHFTSIANLRGLARRRPALAAGLALFMLSLGGIPATGGFLGKYFVFSAAVHSGMVGIALVAVLTSVFALGYYLRVVVAIYMEPAPDGVAPPCAQRLSASLATALCAAMVVLLGLLPSVVLGNL